MPSRSLLYKNLYEEIKIFLKNENSIDFDEVKEKEEDYIKKIEKEINKSINKAKNKDELNNNENNDLKNDDDDKDEDKDNMYKIYSKRRKGEIRCHNKTIKKFFRV